MVLAVHVFVVWRLVWDSPFTFVLITLGVCFAKHADKLGTRLEQMLNTAGWR